MMGAYLANLGKMRKLIALVFCTYIVASAFVQADSTASSRATPIKDNTDANKFLGSFYKSGSGVLVNGLRSISNVPNLTESCFRDVNRFRDQVSSFLDWSMPLNMGKNTTKLEAWALQMLDAWPKIPDGVLSGHINALGDYDQCVAIRSHQQVKGDAHSTTASSFQGKYCLLYVMPDFTQSRESESELKVKAGERSIENLLRMLSITVQAELPAIPSYGSCLPSSCTDEEIFQIVSTILNQFDLTPVASFCSLEEPLKLSTGAIFTISLLAVLAFSVVAATILEVVVQNNVSLKKKSITTSKLYKILHSFSFPTNISKFLKTKTDKNDVGCLHGLRFIGASWVVLCHTYLCGTQIQPVYNLVDAYSYLVNGPISAVVVNGAIVVDIFLVIGGFLVALTLLSTLKKSEGKLNLVLLYVNRYLRITPLYGVIILMGTFIFPIIGSGPYWHVGKIWAGYCERNWWKNLLYINNLPIYDTLRDPNDAPCHGISWYLGVDMQLFLLSPFLLFPIWKWKIYGSFPLIGITLISAVLPGLLTYMNDFLPLSVPFGNVQNRFSQLAYTPTWYRCTPYFIGMNSGLLFYFTRDTKFLTKTKFNLTAAWLMSVAVIFAVLFSPQKFLDSQYHFKALESAIYVSGHRTAWALAISWVIYACACGFGGWINQVLSWKPFVPLSRLTFAIYLVSLHLQFLFHLQYRQPIYFSNYMMVNLFFSHLVMSTLVAFFCIMLIEIPCMNLMKLVMPSQIKTTNKTSHTQSQIAYPTNGEDAEVVSNYGPSVTNVNADSITINYAYEDNEK